MPGSASSSRPRRRPWAPAAGRSTITSDLIQWHFGDDAAREAATDHKESPPPNDLYIRNVNPRLRTLPVRAEATITVNTLAAGYTGGATKDVPVPVGLPGARICCTDAATARRFGSPRGTARP
jgi:hypothetical protein